MTFFDKYVLMPFIESCYKFKERNAFCINEQFFSYHDLFIRLGSIYEVIKKANIKTGNIGLVANDDIETYASIFAIWLNGYAYVPLHPQQPASRNLEIISQADIDIIIDSNNKLETTNCTIIDSSKLKFEATSLEYKSVTENSLAYILFTSGSTGKPKGVQITQGNIGVFMKSFWETGIKIDPEDKCLQCFDLTFDVSAQSFLTALTKGACVYTIPHNQIKYSYVFGLLNDHRLTVGAMAPSMIRYLRPYFDEINIPEFKYCILTAEAIPIDLVSEWSKCIPNADIYDFYGPTEATIYCTYSKFNRQGTNKSLNGMMSIGKPMKGNIAIIVDDEKKILASYQKGELCISGDQVTRGYWKNEQRTSDSIFEISYLNRIMTFYKTGDICYFDDEGDIMLSGRMDYQVKIQGYRVAIFFFNSTMSASTVFFSAVY